MMEKFSAKYILLLMIVIVSRVTCFCQAAPPDSLIKKLHAATDDSVKVRTMLDIGEAIEEERPKESFNYYNQALKLATRINHNRLMLSSMVDIGISHIENNELDDALKTFEKSLPLARTINDTGKIAAVLGNIGNVYLHQSDRVKAIEYYLQAATLLENASNQDKLPVLYSNLCNLFDTQKEFDKSVEYGKRAIELSKRVGDRYAETNAHINISSAYSHLNQPEKALAELNEALPIANGNNWLEQSSDIYNNIGDYYFQRKDYPKALENHLQAYNYTRQMGNLYHLCTACIHLAHLYHLTNQPEKAWKFINQADTLAKQVGSRVDLREMYMTRAEIENSRGEYKAAYQSLSKSVQINDSLFNVETAEKVAEVEERFQGEKKQKEILQLQNEKQIQTLSLKQKSTLNYFLIASLVALLVIGFTGYRNFRHRHALARQQDQLQQQRIRVLEKDQLLVATDAMLKAQEEERSRMAKDLHDGLGGMLSGVKFSLVNMKDHMLINKADSAVFDRSLDMLDTSIRELRRVAHNMMPEALVKFGLDEALKDYCNAINTANLMRLQYQSFGLEERMDQSVEIIVYRVIQELLNNALKHASATEALVQVMRRENRLSITVEDNGKGFDMRCLEYNKGAGWTNIYNRVNYLKGKIDLSAQPGKGVSVNIELIV